VANAGIFLWLCFLLRPPFLKFVPHQFGIMAFRMNLPARGQSL
jgi:hypothetical protein